MYISTLALTLTLTLTLFTPSLAFTQLPVGTTWDYPLGNKNFTASSADPAIKAYGVDLVNTAQSEISTLKADSHYVVCYFSGGSVESYRSDAPSFPSSAVGKVMKGWSDENWLDTRNTQVRDLMIKRIELAQSKGCDGIDVDNIDGYANDSGFDMTEDDAVDFVKAMASAAHERGMAYGLKNGGDLLGRVVADVQWAINEQCVQFDECAKYAVLVRAGKPVFHVEYTEDEEAESVSGEFMEKACGAGGLEGASTIVKHLSLDQWIMSCPTSAQAVNATGTNVTFATGTNITSTTITTAATATDARQTNSGGRLETVLPFVLGAFLVTMQIL